MKVAEVVTRIEAELGGSGASGPAQGLVAGRGAATVRRIIVCQTPSVGILRTAASKPGTLVIAREHPFYLHDESVWSLRTDTELLAANDPVMLGKKQILSDGDVAIYRLSRLWDTAKPKAPATALASTLGWTAAESGGGRKVICDIAPMPLARLARSIGDRLDAGPVRVSGPRDATIRRVALLPEFVSLGEARELMAAAPAVDAILCGESCEWEAAVYLRDTFDMRRAPINMIFAGTQPTQEPGVRDMYAWLARTLKGVPITYIDLVRPVRNLETRA